MSVSAFGVEHGDISKSFVGGIAKPAAKLSGEERNLIRLRNADRLAGRTDDAAFSGPGARKRSIAAQNAEAQHKITRRLTSQIAVGERGALPSKKNWNRRRAASLELSRRGFKPNGPYTY